MEAKDTVIDLGETDNESLKVIMDKILLHQAEITWSIAEKAGMRKVVEHVQECEKRNPAFHSHIQVEKTYWQAQLKKWGL